MDAARFDAIAKALVTTGSRRSALGAAAATLLGVLAPGGRGFAARKPKQPHHKRARGADRAPDVRVSAQSKKKCKGGKKPCGKKCVDLKTDVQNCGRCGVQCISTSPNMRCVDGACLCKPGFAFCGDPGTGGGVCTTLGTVDHCQRCGDACPGSACETVTCDPQKGCQRAPKPDGASCGNNRFCQAGACIDYDFPDTLKLPWCAGDHEPRTLKQDWDGHFAVGIALDFGRRANGDAVVGTPVLAPMAGTVVRDPIPGSTLGNHVLIDAGNGWQVILGHLNAFDADLVDSVHTGDVVGTLGDSGLFGTSGCEKGCPHIHIDLVIGVGNRRYKPDIGKLKRLYGHPRDDFDCSEETGCRDDQAFSTTQRQCSGDACAGVDCSELPHVRDATCRNGRCAIASCDAGFADCDGDPDNGCEAELGTVAACRRCGDRCADTPCTVATCNPQLGCGSLPRSGDACRINGIDGTCVNGTCVTDPCAGKDCSGLSDACNDGVCQHGTCAAQPKPDGTGCGQDGQQCVGGTCRQPEPYVLERKWGSRGTGDGQLGTPRGIAVDDDGFVYVLEVGDTWGGVQYPARVQKFTSDGEFVTKWGSDGTDDGEFSSPRAIAVDSDGLVYVVDLGNNSRLQKFTSDGAFVAKWGRTYGWNDGQLADITSMTLDADDNIYITDYDITSDGTHARIQKFTKDGQFITRWGKPAPWPVDTSAPTPSADGTFYQIHGIAVDPYGFVYVGDPGNERIQKFTSNGQFVGKWGEFLPNARRGGPTTVATDNEGFVYVWPLAEERDGFSDTPLRKFTGEGELVAEWDNPDPIYAGGLSADVMGIAVDNNGFVYIIAAASVYKFAPAAAHGPAAKSGILRQGNKAGGERGARSHRTHPRKREGVRRRRGPNDNRTRGSDRDETPARGSD